MPETLMTSAVFGLAVIGYLGYQDWRDGKFRKAVVPAESPLRFIDESTLAKLIDTLREPMQQLQHHYNDETTAILTEMQNCLRELTELARQQDKKSETILNKQFEMLRYGVPCRPKSSL